MTMLMNDAYINALLADASYVELIDENGEIASDNVIKADLAERLTQPLADFVVANFEVINQEIVDSNGFSATVWQGKAGIDYLKDGTGNDWGLAAC